METALDRLAHGSRVAIIRLRSLGDCVLTTPAIRLLKQSRPDLRVAVVVEDVFAPVFAGNPDIETVLSPSLSAILKWSPQLALNLHGGTKSAQLTVASRARIRAGFTHFRFRSIYNRHIPRAQEILGTNRKVHTAEHLASAVFYLGVPVDEIPRAALFGRPDRGSYAVLHPFASAPDKTWPAGHFLRVAEQLDLEPIFIGGSSDDLKPFSRYRCVQGAGLGTVKSLIAGASLFIGNDSGPAHIAAAFGIPMVVLFGASDPDIWGPWRTESVTLTASGEMAGIEPAAVLEAVSKLQLPTR